MNKKRFLLVAIALIVCFGQIPTAFAACIHNTTYSEISHSVPYYEVVDDNYHVKYYRCYCRECKSWVEPCHPSTSHYPFAHTYSSPIVTYQNNGVSGHTMYTTETCSECKHVKRTSNNASHSLTRKSTRYQNNGASGHTVTTIDACVCGYSVQSSSDAEHTLILSSSEHGTRNTHYVYYRCACGEQVTYSFYCDGNPCPTYAIPMVYSFN